MKSRKAQKRSSSTSNKSAIRRSVQRSFESLEDRRLMTVQPWSDGMYYPPQALSSAWLPKDLSYAEFKAISDIQYADVNNSRLGGEGSQGNLSLVEAEPNSSRATAQFLPLGTGAFEYSGVDVLGTLPSNPIREVFDEDYFAVDLKAGDILDAVVRASIQDFDLTVMDSRGLEITAANTPTRNFTHPNNSPLTNVQVGSVSVAAINPLVIPSAGRYFIRVSQGDIPYTLSLRVYRPAIEAEPIGTKQRIFLDFDGGTVRREIFGAVGTARLSPMSRFLPDWGLSPENENEMIDKIITIFTQRFMRLATAGGNGYYPASGVPGDFDIEILNSRDNPDPWGLPNVSRVIIGGSAAELLIDTVGIAQSVDVGNFRREETAVVLPEAILPNFGGVPVAGNISTMDLVAEALAVVTAHEAGHFFGAWHTDPTNATQQIMDAGGDPNSPASILGVGRDGIFGTPDDTPASFGSDFLDINSTIFVGGFQNTAALLAHSLSTGTQGAYVNGTVFFDVNANRVREAGEIGLWQWRVYADLNNDAIYNFGEPQALTSSVGTFSLGLNPGSYIIRQDLVPFPGWRLTTPVAGFYAVTVTNGQIVQNINFGNERVDQTATGFKWNDLDGDGVVDAGEPRMAGVWIYMDLDGDERIDIGEPQAQTDANGRYSLRFPGLGTYVIREVMEPGFVQTFPGPARNNVHVVTLTGNTAVDATNVAGLNFGNRLFLDFGDAPNSYGTLNGSNGARHGFVQGLRLGANWDAEQEGQPTATALGDDLNGALNANDTVIDDEDGVTLARPLSRTTTNLLSVTATTTAAPAFLHAWVDLNGDGDFTDSGERVISNFQVINGTQTVSFPALGGATLGDTYMRVRLSNDRDLGPTGLSGSGEVEDYRFTIVNAPEIAVADSFQVSRNSTLNSFDVTANDFKVVGETLVIISAGPSRAGGIVQRTSDNKILYTPPNGFVGTDTFPYTVQTATGETSTANVAVTVNLFFEDPRAIDDSFDVPTNALSFPLNVLANDIEGRAGALSIISVSTPNKGGQISIATGGQSLRYTPQRGLGDTETFTYTVADASGKTSTARVTLHTLPGDRNDDDVLIRYVATDLNGNPITAIPQGQQFRIDVYVDDLRNDRSNPPFVQSPGVFSAYADMLYNLQLVSTVPSTTGGRFDFDVRFFNGYDALRLGDASIPGIIDDFGAFNTALAMNEPDPVLMASLTFTARSPGLANFIPDPADDPIADTLLFDNQSTPLPPEKIRYQGTSLEIVGDSVEFPQAVDDSFSTNVPAGALNFPLLVLPNDRTGSTGSIRLFSATQPANGTVAISNNGTPNDLTDDRILYTPNTGFTGTDTFTYTIQDSRSIQSTARVTVRVGSTAVTDANDDVSLRLQVYKLDGTPLGDNETITVGSKFLLKGFVKDLRSPFQGGVFAAFEDVLYNPNLASVDVDPANPLGFAITFGTNYNRLPNPIRSGDIRTPGLINEVGAVQAGDSPLGPEEFELFTIRLTAKAVGNVSFIGDPADISPLHDTLLFQPPSAVVADRIRFGFDSAQIVATGGSGESNTNGVNPFDVNADGSVSPLDVLSVINSLNNGGTSGLRGGEGEGGRLFLDVNADGAISALDALLVINHLNGSKGGEGEGEFSGVGGLKAEGEDDSIESLVNVLAPEIESVWKRK